MNDQTQVTFLVTVPHAETKMSRHDWFFPNGWRGVGPIEHRDKGGRRQGQREGYYPPWFVLMCNNPDCPGRAVVPVSVLTDYADAHDPINRPVQEEL